MNNCLALVVWAIFFVNAQTASAPAPPSKLIDVGGYSIHLYCTGTGSPTVVISGAFSFDWALIQPELAQSTRVCTYDPSGTAWSEEPKNGAPPHCLDRVTELHRLLENGGIRPPFVLVGFSIGGLFTRLYARDYPQDVRGMVIVDHAFVDVGPKVAALPDRAASSSGKLDSPPVLLFSTPITIGLEDDENFKRLPLADRQLHMWAMSNHPLRPTPELASECFAILDDAAAARPFPLGDKPLVVIATSNEVPGYEKLQSDLLALSRNSRLRRATRSSHAVIIDQPELVVQSIREVVEALRKQGGRLPVRG